MWGKGKIFFTSSSKLEDDVSTWLSPRVLHPRLHSYRTWRCTIGPSINHTQGNRRLTKKKFQIIKYKNENHGVLPNGHDLVATLVCTNLSSLRSLAPLPPPQFFFFNMFHPTLIVLRTLGGSQSSLNVIYIYWFPHAKCWVRPPWYHCTFRHIACWNCSLLLCYFNRLRGLDELKSWQSALSF